MLKKTETIGVLNNRAWLAEIPACSWKAMRSSLSSPAARAQTASTPAATGMTMASLRARQKRARVLQQTIDKTGLQLADLDVIAVPAWDVIVNAGKRAWEGVFYRFRVALKAFEQRRQLRLRLKLLSFSIPRPLSWHRRRTATRSQQDTLRYLEDDAVSPRSFALPPRELSSLVLAAHESGCWSQFACASTGNLYN